MPTRARGLRDTPHSAGPRAGGLAQPRLGAWGRSRRPPLPRGRFLTPPRGDHRQAAWPGDSPKEDPPKACGRRSYKVLLEGVEGHDPGLGAEPGASLGSPERPAAPAREPGAHPRSSAHTGQPAVASGACSSGPSFALSQDPAGTRRGRGHGSRASSQSEGRRGSPPHPRRPPSRCRRPPAPFSGADTRASASLRPHTPGRSGHGLGPGCFGSLPPCLESERHRPPAGLLSPEGSAGAHSPGRPA